MIHPYDVLVIGGGIAGMSAAIAAAREGSDVILLEGSERVGKKVIDAADGRCNLTNEQISMEHFYDADPDLVMPILDAFSNQDLMQWLREIGIDLKVEDGRVYPICELATDVVDALRLQMNRYFVRVEAYKTINTIEKKDGYFEAKGVNYSFIAKRIVLATGSKAATETGSGEEGYRVAEQLGLEIKKPLPARTSLRLAGSFSSDWDGVCCEGGLKLLVDGDEVAASDGLLKLTGAGIDGVPAYQVSRFATRALDEGKTVEVALSFLPGMSEEEAYQFLTERKTRVDDYLARDYLLGRIPKKLARMLIREAGIRHSKPIHYLKDEDVRNLARVMTSLKAEVTGHGNFRQAQTCTGGVLTSEVKPLTLEALKAPGIYLAGDLLDVDSMYGGYSMQWAFSSGMAAGLAAVKSAKGNES